MIGVSGDSVESHRSFASGRKLPFRLLADTDGALRKAFGVSKTLGLLPGRVTFIIDKSGVVREVFNSQLFPDKHVSTALATVQELARA